MSKKSLPVEFNVPNLLTLLRALLALPIVWALVRGRTGLALLLIVVGVLTDVFDGVVARRTGGVTPLGKAFDPIADKVTVLSIIAYLVIARGFPLWFVGVVVSRDILLGLASVWVMKAVGSVPEARMSGKIYINALAALTIVYVADIDLLKDYFLWITLIILVVSTAFYVRHYNTALRSAYASRANALNVR